MKLTKIITGSKYNKVGLLKKADGVITETPEESLEVLMDEHFPGNVRPRARDSWLDPNPGPLLEQDWKCN